MNILTHTDVKRALLALEQPERASAAARFFQAHPDGYGAGDQFLGLSMPQQHTVAKRYVRLSLDETEQLLRDPYHECRMTALLIWVYQARNSKPAGREAILERYVANRRYVNNWDLVDSSATALIGETLLTGDRSLLYELADEADPWAQRMALVASLAFIRKGQFADTFALIEQLMDSPYPLVQSAIGWMLRQVDKRSPEAADEFLHDHIRTLSRPALRGAVFSFGPARKRYYLDL